MPITVSGALDVDPLFRRLLGRRLRLRSVRLLMVKEEGRSVCLTVGALR